MKPDDLPLHDIPALSGNNAPDPRRTALDNLPVIGELPADLNGLYVRNGPNPYFPTRLALPRLRRRRHAARDPLRPGPW